MTKTCGECKHLNRELAFCRACGAKWLNETDGANCKYFEQKTPPTNGDKIRHMSNEELAICIDELAFRFSSQREFVAWLNAPAESEGEE